MSGPTLVVFVGALVALLLAMVAMLVWQEGRKRSFDGEPEYVVDHLLGFVRSGLPEEVRDRLGDDGVERIVNWELRYLQRDGGEGAVAGGTAESIAYVVERMHDIDRIRVEPADVGIVLSLEAEYLLTIGAIGEAVETEGGAS